MTDLDAVRRTLTLYGQLLDSGRTAEWGALFAEDAAFTSIPGEHLPGGTREGWTMRGRTRIAADIGAVQDKQRAAHSISHLGFPPIIELDGDFAHAWWDFLVLYGDPPGYRIAHTGRYYAHLVRQGERFVFTQRVSVAAGTPWPAHLPQPRA